MNKKPVIIAIVLLLIIRLSAAEPTINEIMYNPPGNDNNKEFVEIFSDEQINLSQYIIGDEDSNDSLTLLTSSNSTYHLIVEEGFNYSGINSSVYSTGTTIGNNLGNSGDTIFLYHNDSIIDSAGYDGSIANGNGFSIELINESWIESGCIGGSPGSVNLPCTGNQTNQTNQSSDEKDIELVVFLDDFLYINLEYDKLFKVTNKDHISGQTDAINVTVRYNISKDNSTLKQDFFTVTVNSYTTSNTGNYLFENAGNYTVCGQIINSSVPDPNSENDQDCRTVLVIDTSTTPCNISLSIESEKIIYQNQEQIKFYNSLTNASFPFQIEYWIEDLFNHIIKNRINTTNLNQKSYTPNIDTSVDVYLIRSRLVFLACNDSDSSDNEAGKLVIINNSKEDDSEITIEKVYTGTDNSVKFGESFKVKLTVYKGDSTKSSLKIYVEDNDHDKLSYVSYVNCYKKFSENTMTVSIQMKKRCSNADSGTHKLVVEGLDEREFEQIEVEGYKSECCREKTECLETKESKKKLLYEIVEKPAQIGSNSDFKVKVKITNNETEDHSFKVWSYVYRGSKSYSGEREQNMQQVNILAGTSATIELENRIIEADPGEYKFKVKIKKDNQKTDYEITETLDIVNDLQDYQEDTADHPKIVSFYTRAKKFSDEINLYSTIHGSGNYTLFLESIHGSEEMKISLGGKDRFDFKTRSVPGKNTFLLYIKDDESVYDLKSLIIFFNETGIQEKTENIPLKNGLGSITGRSVDDSALIYESSSFRARNLAKYIIPFLSSLLSLIIIFRKI